MNMFNRKALSSLIVLAFALSQTGCEQGANSGSPAPTANGNQTETADSTVRMAVAELQPTEGNEARGIVTFTEVEGGVHVLATLEGMTGEPGPRGFHIHEHGDCAAPDGTSAGGHFNPTGMPHGAPDDEERHMGDFGNLEVNANGEGLADFVDSHISLTGPNSIIGRGVIVHAEADDLESQPTGAAGARVACGVIEEVDS